MYFFLSCILSTRLVSLLFFSFHLLEVKRLTDLEVCCCFVLCFLRIFKDANIADLPSQFFLINGLAVLRVRR